jgi:uncharacterized membrane protein YfcA
MDNSVFILSGGLLLAIGIGVLTGIFGVGGGFLLTPALMIILGIPGPIAVGTGLAMMFVNSSYGMLKRRGTGTLAVNIALSISTGSLVGVMIGSWLLERLKFLPPLVIYGRELVAAQFILLCAFLLVMVWVAGFMFHDYRHTVGRDSKERVGLLSHIKIPPYGHFASLDQPRMSFAALVLLGLLTGFLTGLMGIGGGVVLLPALIYLVGLHTQKAAGTSLMLVWISSFIAVISHVINHNINWILWIALVTGGLLGTFLGTRIGLRVAGPKLRLYFVYVVIAAILLVGYKIVGMVMFAGR